MVTECKNEGGKDIVLPLAPCSGICFHKEQMRQKTCVWAGVEMRERTYLPVRYDMMADVQLRGIVSHTEYCRPMESVGVW